MYRDYPWSLTKEKINKKSIKKDFCKNFKMTSIIKVYNIFKNNVEGFFSNKDLKAELNLSKGTISKATDRLQALGKIKISKLTEHQGLIYQHVNGSGVNTEKIRKNKNIVKMVQELFKENKNITFTKEYVFEAFPSYSKRQIGSILNLLLCCSEIELVNTLENGKIGFKYKT